MEKIKKWWSNNRLVIMRNKKLQRMLKEKEAETRLGIFRELKPIIHSLWELRHNTWDKDRVAYITDKLVEVTTGNKEKDNV